MNAALGLGIAFVILFLALYFYQKATSSGTQSSEEELFRLCRGDRQMLERLIALEQSRGKASSREMAAKAAVYSFKRDNR